MVEDPSMVALRNDTDTESAVTVAEIGISEAARPCLISPVVGKGVATLGPELVRARGLNEPFVGIVSSTNQRMSISGS